MKLLVVEDDPLIQRALRQMVEAWGYACDEASDGEQAWEMARQCPYDLILLDLSLPKLDGISFCRRLRAAGGHQPLILMLTARDTNRDKVVGLDQGADDYMVKPFDPDVLRARVQALLGTPQPRSRRPRRPLWRAGALPHRHGAPPAGDLDPGRWRHLLQRAAVASRLELERLARLRVREEPCEKPAGQARGRRRAT